MAELTDDNWEEIHMINKHMKSVQLLLTIGRSQGKSALRSISPVRMTINKKTCAGEDMWARNPLVGYVWKYKLSVVTMEPSLKKKKKNYCMMRLCHSCDSRVLNHRPRDPGTFRFMATLFHNNQDMDPPTHPSANERLKKT